MTQSALLPENNEKPPKAVTMSAFITLAEKVRRGGSGKLILQIEVMAICCESIYCLSHRITSLECLLSFILRDSPCLQEPSQPSQEPSSSRDDMQSLRATGPMGLRQGRGIWAGAPGQSRGSQDSTHMSFRLLQKGRCPQERSRSSYRLVSLRREKMWSLLFHL